ncbi:hypothetical protein DR64_7398 [Paraburkholderia xenovorans LB400]|jgi:predicted PurR-regulated permease PerM|uniref:Membrane protein n=2 Tax=Paraburkholderia xenovorans TaxID=36873 RepID=Q13PV0_PARXL|nr:AI-2E family transporter [Paraburkholderia xenovorans]ABE33889.1 Putative membrane protein [Paraburkholderia xenovorans LB400]AIP36073.1 hypothetical protein DR64_7398 [Paraburkholderia xenovorans LB400]
MKPTPIMLDRKRVIQAMLLAAILVLGYVVLWPFVIPVAWALIIAYVTWPLYCRLHALIRGRAWISALLMTLLVGVVAFIPIASLISPVFREFLALYRNVAEYAASGPLRVPDFIARIPWLGHSLQQLVSEFADDPQRLHAYITQSGDRWVGELASMVGSVGRNAVKLGFATLTLFFAYRDGRALLLQVQGVMRPVLGDRLDGYLSAIGGVTRSVVYGLALTAVVQGALAGLGYWAAGVKAPLLLTIITTLAALIPFGTPFVWIPVGVGLIANGNMFAGVGLLLWGALVVSWVDNLIRPMVISNAVRVPFLLILFGVLGGIGAFGFIGLFVGPVVVAILLALWREWCTSETGTGSVDSTGQPSSFTRRT